MSASFALNFRPLQVLTFSLLLGTSVVMPVFGDEPNSADSIYFPATGQEWAVVNAQDAGWDKARLDAALEYAIQNRSTGIVVLHRGKIMAERYRDLERVPAVMKQRIVLRTNAKGHSIEDVASCQKSVVSVLIGIAKHKGLLKLDDPVLNYLGKGWSSATAAQESDIQIRHLLTMTSGLTEEGVFQAAAGTRWKYNTAMYAKLMDVLTKVTNTERNELTREWLTEPLAMSESEWVERKTPTARSANQFGFATSPRDLAKFGLMMLAEGEWDGESIVRDKRYLSESITTSQNLNPFYGYLWWLNRNESQPNDPKRISSAPRDMFAAKGAGNRRCWVVPSLDLVVTRLGAPPTDGKEFDQQFWKLLMQAKR